MKFVPGALVACSLPGIGGLVVRVPDNLEAREGRDVVSLVAAGFPTITITRKLGEFEGQRLSTRASAGAVTVTYTIPTMTWNCTAEDTGAHEQLVVDVCESMSAPINPHVEKMKCETITGFDAESVTRTWVETGPAFIECLTRLDDLQVSFGLDMRREVRDRSYEHFTTPEIVDKERSLCIDRIHARFEQAAAFEEEDGVKSGPTEEDDIKTGRAVCSGQYSQY